MTSPVISVEHLTKQYDLGVIGTGTLSRDLNRWWARVRKQPDPYTRIGQQDAFARIGESILALDDVSFTVQQGEALGIIGRNGAGKSTLLKILSRVTAPSSGVVKVKGRIGSLLEVGTGFHPELTGRENVYLNGAILGMKKDEVTRKFDEIVAFSGVEKFIDTPVKRYSSGMYVRLAFAVAAHLDPEILIVDEVLAVGDAEFQKKCLGKMGDVAGEGRTVLFVSHNMGAIQNLCNKSILLSKGSIDRNGNNSEVISSYLYENRHSPGGDLENCKRSGNGKLRITGFHFESENGRELPYAVSGEPVYFVLNFSNFALTPEDRVSFSFGIHDEKETGISHYYSHFSNTYFSNLPATGKVRCFIDEVNLSPGRYLLSCRVIGNGDLRTAEEIDWPKIYTPFNVEQGDYYKIGSTTLSSWGPVLIKGDWTITGNDKI